MKNKGVIITIVIVVGILALVAMYFYQKNKAEQQAKILKQQQLASLAAAGADIKMGVDWSKIFIGVGGIAVKAATGGIL